MNAKPILDRLQGLAFVRGLAEEHLAKLAAMGRTVSFAENEILFREGDLRDVVYLIEAGMAAVEIYVPGRGRTTILTVGPGQLLGWSSLFENKPKTATARTVVPVLAIAFDAAQLREVCQTDHTLGCAITWRVAEVIADRLKATRLQLVDIFAPAGE